jgi:hypothetical protein
VIYGHHSGGHQEDHHEEHYGPAKYEFSYEVHDVKHGDIKHQKESRDGDHVVGEYSLIEPDGHRRTVKYSSDKHTGFIAEVHREKVEGYQAPIYHQQAAYGHENSHAIHKVVVAPVHYASNGHQSSHAQSGHQQQHAQISHAVPVQKVISAPVHYASSGHQNLHSTHQISAAPIHYASSGHQSLHSQSGHGQQQAQISHAVPVQKVIIAATNTHSSHQGAPVHYASSGHQSSHNNYHH